MLLGLKAEAALERVDRILERGVVEGHEQPAFTADEVVVMVVALLDWRALVASNAIADVDARDQPQILQYLDAAIDAGDPDGPLDGPTLKRRSKPLVDLLHGDRASLAGKHLDQQVARSAASVAGSADQRSCAFRPCLLLSAEGAGVLLDDLPAGRHAGSLALINAKMIMRIRIIIVSLRAGEPSRIEDSSTGSGGARIATLVPGWRWSAAVAGCGRGAGASRHAQTGVIRAVGAENEYANVISQIGGKYVAVTAIMSNPNTDPHTFEASPGVAQTVSSAQLVVQNGVGYDSFMNKIESASASSSRRVIDVQKLLGLPDATRNPHLWYEPATMPLLAAALVKDLAALEPAHKAYFAANASRFNAALQPWRTALATFKRSTRRRRSRRPSRSATTCSTRRARTT